MEALASETMHHFSDATCHGLLSLILRSGGMDAHRDPPQDFLVAIRDLVLADPAFAHWCRSRCDEANSGEDLLPIARRLAECLVSTGWDCSQEPSSPLRFQLLNACHLVARVRALQSSFAIELERQKTEAIYHFAYGLSHELNNPLANIATRAGVLKQAETCPKSKAMLDTIVVNAMRGCEMLGDLMLVAKPPLLSFEPIEAVELMSQVVAQSKPWTDKFQVQMSLELDSNRWLRADAVALREALWCLIRNAVEAMPTGGEICLCVRDQCLERVGIEVADQGSGLSPEALEHAFDPYFSGREAGRGLGLGLAKTRRIVELHGGRIVLYNQAGGGCVASILLPAIESAEPQ